MLAGDNVSERVFFDIVTIIGAILLGLTAWAIFTGKHDTFYRKFRRQGIPPNVPRHIKRARHPNRQGQ
jgi:hypothetical protein